MCDFSTLLYTLAREGGEIEATLESKIGSLMDTEFKRTLDNSSFGAIVQARQFLEERRDSFALRFFERALANVRQENLPESMPIDQDANPLTEEWWVRLPTGESQLPLPETKLEVLCPD